MDELLNDFLVETAEHIDAAGMQLVLFENNPSDKSIIASIFRLLHTIKGTCGFLGLTRLELLTHAAEALISRLREGAHATSEMVSLILQAVDRVKFILTELEAHAREPVGEDTDLIAALEEQIAHSYRETTEYEPASTYESASKTIEPAAAQAQSQTQPHYGSSVETSPRRTETIRVAVDVLERVMLLVSELVLTRNQLLELSRRQEDETTKAPLQRLSTLLTDLQDTVGRA